MPGQPGHENSVQTLIAEVQPERLLFKVIVQVPASREPAALSFLGGFVVARAAVCRCTGCGLCVAHQHVGSPLLQLVALQGVRLSQVQEGNPVKQPS